MSDYNQTSIIYFWSSGDWCFHEDLEVFSSDKSDDYTVIRLPLEYSENEIQSFVDNYNRGLIYI